MLELHRGDEVKREPVRYHALRDKVDGRFVGFFLDFGWDHANDLGARGSTSPFLDPNDRNLGSYFDATILISFYLFENGLAKRVRWRVRAAGGSACPRPMSVGGRGSSANRPSAILSAASG